MSNQNNKIPLDFGDWPITAATQRLEPAVFWDNGDYTCLFGPDKKNGILGRGVSPYEAVLNWEQNLHDRLAAASEDDDVVKKVRHILDF